MADLSTTTPAVALPPVIHYVRTLRRQWWVLLVVLASVLAATAVVTATEGSVYRSAMDVVAQGGEIAGSAQPLTQTLTSLLESEALATRVVTRLELDRDPRALLAHLKVTTPPESSILTATFDDGNPRVAVAVLDQLGQLFPNFVTRTLDAPNGRPASNGTPITKATVFDPARLTGQVSPTWRRNLLVAVVIGAALGLLAAFGREALAEASAAPRAAPRPLLAALRHRWWLLLLLALLGAGVGGAAVDRRDARGYRAVTMLTRVEPAVVAPDSPLLAAADPRVSYGAVILRAARQQPDLGVATLRAQTHVSVVGAEVASIVAAATTRAAAVFRSRAVALAFAAEWQAVYAGLLAPAAGAPPGPAAAPGAQPTLRVAPTSSAAAVARPIARGAGLGLLLGLCAGAAIAAGVPPRRRVRASADPADVGRPFAAGDRPASSAQAAGTDAGAAAQNGGPVPIEAVVAPVDAVVAPVEAVAPIDAPKVIKPGKSGKSGKSGKHRH